MVCRLFICGLMFGNTIETQTFNYAMGLGARVSCWFTDSFAKYLIQRTKAMWCLRSSRQNHKSSTPFLYYLHSSFSIHLKVDLIVSRFLDEFCQF